MGRVTMTQAREIAERAVSFASAAEVEDLVSRALADLAD